MREKKRVLFLCTANSARSQMAEGLVDHFLGEEWVAYSGGTDPAASVHPLAVEAMLEQRIDISSHQPKSVDEYHGATFDLVVTLCDDAARDCPLWVQQGHVIHMGLPDPAQVTGSQHERLAAFREIRDAIGRDVLHHLTQMDSSTAEGSSNDS